MGLPCVYGGGSYAKQPAVPGTVPVLESSPVRILVVHASSPSPKKCCAMFKSCVPLRLIFSVHLPYYCLL